MFDALAAAVSSLDIPCDGRAVAEALALLDRLTAKVAAAVGEFDRSGGWSEDGSVSMHSWLRGHGLTSRQAGRLVGLGRRVASLPVLRAAWESGELSGAHVRAVAANVSEPRIGLFAEHEAATVPLLAGQSPAQAAATMRAWRLHADNLEAPPDDPLPDRSVYLSKTLEGRFEMSGSLDAEGGAVVARALALADSGDLGVPAAQRRADALVDVARHFLDNQFTRRGGRHRPHLNVVVDFDALLAGKGGQLADEGLPVDGATVERLLCDGAVSRVVTRGRSAILDYGTSTRTIPAPLWSALVVRDRQCRFPGCDRPPSWCEGHHVVWFRHGGTTSLDNLVLLCTRHHHLLHAAKGWRAKLLPDGEFEVTRPDGSVTTTRAPPLADLRREEEPSTRPP